MKKWLFYPLVATAITALLVWLARMPVGYAALIAFIGWPVGGTLITADDDLPGGFSNPHGTTTPHWATPAFWGQLFGGGAVVSLAFLVQFGFAPPWSYFLPSAAVLLGFLSFLFLRRSRQLSQHAG